MTCVQMGQKEPVQWDGAKKEEKGPFAYARVCVWEREREREREGVCERERERVWEREREREGGRRGEWGMSGGWARERGRPFTQMWEIRSVSFFQALEPWRLCLSGPHVGNKLCSVSQFLITRVGKMYERYKRRYSLCAKGERTLDVVLIKVRRSEMLTFSAVALRRYSWRI